jgi:3-oxoacyl-[acyl-carrier-protein] synthase-3
VVLGNVGESRGFVAESHRTDSSHPFWLAASPRGRAWYAEGQAVLHAPDPIGSGNVFLMIADQAREAATSVLARAGLRGDDVGFFASHQAMPWLRPIAQEWAGVSGARACDTYAETGSVFAANVPLVLRRAEDQGLLSSGDLAMLFGGGTGVTYGATLLRWGR